MVIQVLGAFFAVVTFAIIFSVPRRFLLYTGITGALGWLVYLLMLNINAEGFKGIFVASLTVALLSHSFARIFKAPVTVFLISGILPLVPGVGMYRIVYFIVTDDMSSASYYFIYTLQIAGAIAIAIFVMDTVFKLLKRDGKQKVDVKVQ